VEGLETLGLLGAVGPQDQVKEGSFFFCQVLLLLVFTQVGVHSDVMLALVLAQVENFKGAVVLALRL
jgi:hypothetical protein